MKCKLLCVLLWLCATGVSAQHLTVKNYQKKVHPGLTAITMELNRDQNPISNVDWMEYLYWLEQIYGKESAEYQAALPDKQALRQQLPDSIAQHYSKHPAYK